MKNLAALAFLVSSISFGQMAGLGSSGQISGIGSNPGVPGNMLPSDFQNDFTPTRLLQDNVVEVEIVNSPFIEEDYQKGKTTIHGKPGFTAKMRYNAAKDVIEFIDDDAKVKELLRRPYISAELDGKQFVILDYKVAHKNIEKLGYFNPLNKGLTQLLFMPKKKIELTGYSFQERRSGVYKDVSAYFIKHDGKPATNISLNKSSIFNHLDPTYEKVLSYYITENDIKLRKEEDVIRLLEYYNTLIAKKGT